MESLFLSVRTAKDPTVERTRGTAWLLWPDVVVTALHVVGTPQGSGSWAHEKWVRKPLEEGADAYLLRLPSGAQAQVTPIAYDPLADVAILRLPAGAKVDEDAFGVLATDGARAGDPWRAVGYPAFERDPRAIALQGTVSFVGDALTNNAIQLQVVQGTGVNWGGISGCAAQSTWGEVFGVVVQTVAGIATCNAAPAEAVARLIRLRGHQAEIAGALAERLRAIGSDAVEEVANALWSSLSVTEGFDADPAGVLANRIAQAGRAGLLIALAEIQKKLTAAGKSAPDAGADPILGRFEIAVMERPNEADRIAVLSALADAGGEISKTGDLAKRLPAMPRAVLEATVEALLDEGGRAPPVIGMRGLDGNLTLRAEGARRVVRRDYLRAALRALRSGDTVAPLDLAARSAIGPAALARTIVCADRMGAIARSGDDVRITQTGRAWLALRPGEPEPGA